MILDSSLAFDGPTAVAITVTRDSTNVLDMGVARDMGIGTPLRLVILGNGLFAAAGAATLTIAVQGSDVEGSGYVAYAQTPALSIAQLNSGLATIFPISLPRPPSGAVARPRYYKLVYTVATGPFTAGAIIATLGLDRDDAVYYPAGYSTQYV